MINKILFLHYKAIVNIILYTKEKLLFFYYLDYALFSLYFCSGYFYIKYQVLKNKIKKAFMSLYILQ
jgi:hypothetical protein